MAVDARNLLGSLNRSARGIRPELCPAIRQFYCLGVYVYSPIDFRFHDRFTFDVEVMENQEGHRILMPGVIGAPGSPAFYARIDTGFSFGNLSYPVIGILNQHQSLDFGPAKLSPVVYPVGYTGPILIPLTSPDPFEVSRNMPLLHLISMGELNSPPEVVDRHILHPKFEGLLYEDSFRTYRRVRSVKSTDLVTPRQQGSDA
jgi:hypothetical protein